MDKLSQKLELFIQGLILFSLLTFSLETLPNLSEKEKHWLYISEIATIGIFTIEYLTRLILSKRKLSYITSVRLRQETV